MNAQSPPLSTAVLRKIDAYWRAANYLSVGQIYLYDNPLLKKPLTLAHIKPRSLGRRRFDGQPLLLTDWRRRC